MNQLLLTEIVTMVRWGINSIEADAKGEKTEAEIIAEQKEMQTRFDAAVARWEAAG